MKSKFKKRYVLAIGYPKNCEGESIMMYNKKGFALPLKSESNWFVGYGCPKYRLVLEEVKK